jgi:hypothetical protein
MAGISRYRTVHVIGVPQWAHFDRGGGEGFKKQIFRMLSIVYLLCLYVNNVHKETYTLCHPPPHVFGGLEVFHESIGKWYLRYFAIFYFKKSGSPLN